MRKTSKKQHHQKANNPANSTELIGMSKHGQVVILKHLSTFPLGAKNVGEIKPISQGRFCQIWQKCSLSVLVHPFTAVIYRTTCNLSCPVLHIAKYSLLKMTFFKKSKAARRVWEESWCAGPGAVLCIPGGLQDMPGCRYNPAGIACWSCRCTNQQIYSFGVKVCKWPKHWSPRASPYYPVFNTACHWEGTNSPQENQP